jgi:DNA-binding NarL/FixJ family response regulator
MEKRSDISLRVLIVAGSHARQVSLAGVASKALDGRAQIMFDSRISTERFAASKSDVLVADLDTSALAAAMIHFLEEAPAGTGTVALIDEPEPVWVRSALAASINAILARDAGADDLQLALRAADAGFVLLHPTSVRGLAPDNSPHTTDDAVSEDLTAREAQILRLVSFGLGNKEIAGKLAISEHTVKFHMSSILGKLNAGSRTEAVTLGIRRGLIPV